MRVFLDTTHLRSVAVIEIDLPDDLLERLFSSDHSFVTNELSLLELEKDSAFGKDCTVLSRIYRIIHDKKTLIWINEMFPLDDRWSL